MPTFLTWKRHLTRGHTSPQANDFEAYQELLRQQGAKETQGERYEVITKFLNDTEEYLHKLAGKVSNVKLQQEASEAFTKATAEARAMVRPRHSNFFLPDSL